MNLKQKVTIGLKMETTELNKEGQMNFVENVKKIFYNRFSDITLNLTERSKFFDKFLSLGLPTLKHEDWKYTNLAFLNDIDFHPVNDGTSFDQRVVFNSLDFFNGSSLLVVPFVNGNFSSVHLPSSFEFVSVQKLNDEYVLVHDENLQKFLSFYNDTNPFGFLNIALNSSAIKINIEDNAELEFPIVLFYYYDTDVSALVNTLSFIEVGENAKANLIVIFANNPNKKILANEYVNLYLKPNSNVEINFIQSNLNEIVLMNNLNVLIDGNSSFKVNTFTIDTEFVRNNLTLLFNEPNSEAFLNGIYIVSNDEFVDDHTIVIHQQPNCKSDENFRGILDGNGRAVFNGKIYVARNAQKTNAYQSNKNLLLSNEAKINTRPQLEIYADDVRCTHGATAGFLDKEMLFYIVSRGIDKEKAKSLLLNSFVSENLEKVSVPELRNYMKELVAKKLNLEDIFFCSAIDEISNVTL